MDGGSKLQGGMRGIGSSFVRRYKKLVYEGKKKKTHHIVLQYFVSQVTVWGVAVE